MQVGDVVYDKLDPQHRPMVIIDDHVVTPRPRTFREWLRGSPPHPADVDRTNVVVRMRLNEPLVVSRHESYSCIPGSRHVSTSVSREYWENIVMPVAQLTQ